jgi:hypothetical protein
MNQARTLVELGELYAANLLTEQKSTFPGKDTFKLQKEKTPKAAEAKKDAFITTKSKLGSGPEAAVGFAKSQLDPKLIKKAKNDEYGVLKDSPTDKEFSVSSEKSEVKTINNSMNKSIFDRLYEEVMGDETSPSHNDMESADAEALDITTGEEEGEVTVTLDRETAQKLHDVLMAVLSSEEEKNEDEDEEMGEEDSETAFEATDIKELPDSTCDTLKGKDNKVKASWSSHHVDGEEGDGQIKDNLDAKGKVIANKLIGSSVSSDTESTKAKSNVVPSRATKNVGKVAFTK